VRGVMHVGSHRHPDFRSGFLNMDERAEKPVDRAIYIHGFQGLEMAPHTSAGS
jgi:hypothetical protein